MQPSTRMRPFLGLAVLIGTVLAGGAVARVQDQCGPFTDVSPAFCPYVLEMFYLGITAGTSPTTYSPDNPVTRGQAAVFVSKGVNQSIGRSSRRAALGQWWTTTPHWTDSLGVTDVGILPHFVACDGADVWVQKINTVDRVRASDGKLLETWTGLVNGSGVVSAMGRVFVPGDTNPAAPHGGTNTGVLYMIDPSQPAGAVTTVATGLSPGSHGIAFDGDRLWVTNFSGISIVTPGSTTPWPAVNVTTGFSTPLGIVFDGSSMWVTDPVAGSVFRLDANGAIVQTVQTGTPGFPVFDGENIWVPRVDSVYVLRAATGEIIATPTGNGLTNAYVAGFDGQRIAITNLQTDTISLFRAADASPIGSFSTGTGSQPVGVVSDGLNFWVALSGVGRLARF